MTKKEREILEKLCDEAIMYAKRSGEDYEINEKGDKELIMASIHLRRADQNFGYAQGIYQALAAMRYDSKKMAELRQML